MKHFFRIAAFMFFVVFGLINKNTIPTGTNKIGGNSNIDLEVSQEVDLYLMITEGADDRERSWWTVDGKEGSETDISIQKHSSSSYTIDAPTLNLIYDVNGDGIGSFHEDDIETTGKFYFSGSFNDYDLGTRARKVTDPNFIKYLKSLRTK